MVEIRTSSQPVAAIFISMMQIVSALVEAGEGGDIVYGVQESVEGGRNPRLTDQDTLNESIESDPIDLYASLSTKKGGALQPRPTYGLLFG